MLLLHRARQIGQMITGLYGKLNLTGQVQCCLWQPSYSRLIATQNTAVATWMMQVYTQKDWLNNDWIVHQGFPNR